MNAERSAPAGDLFLGMDIGSSTTKCVLVSAAGAVVGHTVINTLPRHADAVDASMALLEERFGVRRADLKAVAGTGYGRNNIPFADKRMTELACHAKGAWHLHPAARTVIDIGGQDSKVIRVEPGGVMAEFVMNEKCAAGTGRFLEAMARILHTDLAQFEGLDARSAKEVAISTICTVFAESEVISHIAKGAAVEDVVRAVHRSIAEKVGGMARRLGAPAEVVMTGGVARNRGVVRALERVVGSAVTVVPDPQVAGALGAALVARDLFRS